MIIKIKCDDGTDLYDLFDKIFRCTIFNDGTHITDGFKIHKTTTVKQVEYVVEKIDTATASELAQRCNNIQRRWVK